MNKEKEYNYETNKEIIHFILIFYLNNVLKGYKNIYNKYKYYLERDPSFYKFEGFYYYQYYNFNMNEYNDDKGTKNKVIDNFKNYSNYKCYGFYKSSQEEINLIESILEKNE